ncbi:MAG: thiamine-phosphate kinase [Hellea sp.]|nr:thiamine-phosphate kinase [Hellea sp.]
MNEFDLIAKYFAPLAGPEGLKLKDDAAHFSPPAGFDVVLTKDTMVEAVHFPAGRYGSEVAERLLRVNLSDLAAKGATPRGYLLSIAWPKNVDHVHMQDFANGLKSSNEKFKISLWGGDTVAIDGPAVFTATLVGTMPEGLSVTRSGARPGHDIYLTGYLGKGYFGLKGLSKQHVKNDLFYKPAPRLELRTIIRTWASASIDVSDGFAADISHLAETSSVSAVIETDELYWPDDIQKWLANDSGRLNILLTHGDDYEVLFTAHPDHRDEIQKAAQTLDFKVQLIGRCGLGQGVTITSEGHPLAFEQTGYKHFQ